MVGWLIDSKRPGKQFFSHVGTELPLLWYYQYFWGVADNRAWTVLGQESFTLLIKSMQYSILPL